MNFTNLSWCGLTWTGWISFATPSAFKNLPSCPGMYRIREINGNELFYIGETGRNLRERLGDLRRNSMNELMPYNDPHTAAPSLWAWHDAEGIEFECSVVPVTLADDEEKARKLREGLEFYLLWQYRLEFGASTRCNHGRFHPRYMKSTDRKKGKRGYRLPDNVPDNPSGGPSCPPLQLAFTPFDDHWMGLPWCPPRYLSKANLSSIVTSPGVYRIFDLGKRELLYIGETGNLRNRLRDHEKNGWRVLPLFSYVKLPDDIPTYQRHEIENDLIGSFYAQTNQIPILQLRNYHKSNAGL